MHLSFVVQKKKRKSKINFSGLIIASLISLAVAINVLLGLWFISHFSNSLTTLIKPPFYVSPTINGTVSLAVGLLAAIGTHFSILYESKKSQLILLLVSSFILNLILLACVFALNSLALSLLVIVSNVVVCCFYFKQLKARSLGQLLFIPYITWLLFNTVIVYAMFLLN